MIFADWKSRHRGRLAVAAATIGLVLGGARSGFALSLTGAVTNAGNYSIAQLPAFAAVSETGGSDV